MDTANTALIERYAPVLLDPHAPIDRDRRMLMDNDGDLAIYYAPFEHFNPAARIALVGITPGPTQMVNASLAARAALQSGRTVAEALRTAKETGAFSGTVMRGNLVRQMNHWGVHTFLGLRDAGELFRASRDILHTTSLLRYPVFVKDEAYAGTPNMLRTPLLKRHLLAHFVEEARLMPEALFFPLGPKVAEVLSVLADEGVIDSDRVVDGMLHPSPNNTYRLDYLLGGRVGAVPYRTNPVPYDTGRQAFRARHLGASAA